jgi:hypothetical protein
MISKTVIAGLTFLVLILTSAFAQDWRKSPLNSKNSDAWRNRPYTGKTSDSWRKSRLNSNDSQLRWNKNKWQKSKMHWRNSSTTWNKKNWQDRPTHWRNSANKWNKQQWRDNPFNWRNSDLEWKNNRKRYERGSIRQEIKEWESPNVQKPPDNTEEKKEAPQAEEDLQPQIEIIEVDDNLSDDAFTEAADDSSDQKNLIVVYGSQGVKVIQQSEPSIKKFDDGTIVIYGSSSEN